MATNALVGRLIIRRRFDFTRSFGSAPHVTVIGAGVVGLTSAHSLRRRGFRVTVLERRSHVASECSFGNAANLLTSYSRPPTPTNAEIFRMLTSRAGPMHCSWQAMMDPAMASFLLRFNLVGPWKIPEIKRTTQITHSLASISMELIDRIREERNMVTSSTNAGLLMFFTDKTKMDKLCAETREVMSEEQVRDVLRVLTPDECVALEPKLAMRKTDLVGGLFWPKDRTMCSLSFARELASKLEQSGVTFELNEDVVGASCNGGEHHVSLASGRHLKTDAIVVAAGVGSGNLLQQLSSVGPPGLSPCPLYGARGHSLTIEASHLCEENDKVLQRSIADGDSMTFYSPLPETCEDPHKKLLRIASFGDMDGWDFGPGAVRPWRLQQLRSAAERTFGPKLWACQETHVKVAGEIVNPPVLVPKDDPLTTWCGLRPMSPDKLPLIGRMHGKNGSRAGFPLFVNAGHGNHGWTISAASGELLAEVVSREMAATSHASSLLPCSEDLHKILPHLDPNRFRLSHVFKKAFSASE